MMREVETVSTKLEFSINYWDGQYVLLQKKRLWIFSWYDQIDCSPNFDDIEATYQKLIDKQNNSTNGNNTTKSTE
jgi:hypothetical protein